DRHGRTMAQGEPRRSRPTGRRSAECGGSHSGWDDGASRMSTRTVTSQAELDQAIADKVDLISINSPAGVWLTIRDLGSSSAELRGSSRAVLWESSSAVLRGSSRAVLWESSSAELWESSSAELRGSSRAVLWESSSAVLRGSSRAVLWESSSAELRGSSSAELRESSRAELRESSSVHAYNKTRV